MKSKKFYEIKPYCYQITRKKDDKKYFGVRWSNVAKNRPPIYDLGKIYFTSRPSLSKDFKKNKNNYEIKFVYTFDTILEARDYELKFNKKILKNDKWLNTSAFPQIIHTKKSKEKLRQIRLGTSLSKKIRFKISKSNTGKKHRKDSIDRMKLAQIGDKHWAFGLKGKKNPRYGHKHTEEFKKKRKKISQDLWKNNSFRKKVVESMKGRIPWNKGKKNIYSDEVLKKMSLAKKNKPSPHVGKKMSETTKRKMKLAWIERRKKGVSEETRKKLSLAFSGKNHPLHGLKGKDNPNYGRKNSKKTKTKMSISAKLSWTPKRKAKLLNK
jgi:hypothetical protein